MGLCFSDRQIASPGPVQTQEFTYEDIDTNLAILVNTESYRHRIGAGSDYG